MDRHVDQWNEADDGLALRTEVLKVYVNTFTNLEPNTLYAIIVKLGYRLPHQQFFWPTDYLKFTYNTTGIIYFASDNFCHSLYIIKLLR